jgi:hypothetical protein
MQFAGQKMLACLRHGKLKNKKIENPKFKIVI